MKENANFCMILLLYLFWELLCEDEERYCRLDLHIVTTDILKFLSVYRTTVYVISINPDTTV